MCSNKGCQNYNSTLVSCLPSTHFFFFLQQCIYIHLLFLHELSLLQYILLMKDFYIGICNVSSPSSPLSVLPATISFCRYFLAVPPPSFLHHYIIFIIATIIVYYDCHYSDCCNCNHEFFSSLFY